MKNDVPSTLDGLREQLFSQLAAIREKTPSPEALQQSRAVCDLAGRLIDTARCEIDYHKMVNSSSNQKALESNAANGKDIAADRQLRRTATGTLEVVPVAGGAIQTHRLR